MRSVCAKAVALALVLNLGIPGPYAMAARFVDLSGNWAEKYINTLSDKGVIAAEKDGKFRPNDPVTRAVFAAWLVKVLGIDNQPVSSTPSFPDVKPSDWFFKPVEIIRQNNYISGYADGFRPNQFIQKGEVIAIIARTLNVSTPDEATIASTLARFKDGSKVPDWARVGVVEAAQADILGGDKDPSLVGATTIATRADTAVLLYRLDAHNTKKDIAESEAQAVAAQSAPMAGPQAAMAQAYPAQQGAYQQPAPNYAQAPYQGQVQQGQYPPQQGYAQPGGYPPQQGYAGGYAPPGSYPPPQQGYAPQQGYPQQGAYPAQGGYLQGGVAIVAAGTHFQASLKNSIDSGSTQPGEEVTATLSAPLYSNGMEVVPAGSKLVGQVTNVVSAARFKAGANGKVDIRFTSVETPDGRRFPLSASVDSNQLRLTGGTTAGRVGKGIATAGAGAAAGALFGTALGPIVGATSSGRAGKATGMGAVFGTAIGATAGGVGAVVRKGSEVKIPAGTQLPVQLDESMQVTTAARPPYGAYPTGGYAPPPVQQPAGGYYPQ